jgi:cysteine desulfurase
MIALDKITYLDNNATTAIDPAVLEAMRPYLEKYFANPSSGYRFAAQVRDALEQAREQVAALLGCEPGEIVFTSCGTESNNTAFHSALETRPECKHIVTTAVEHSAVRKPTQELERHGYEVTVIGRRSIGPAEFARIGRCHPPQHGACFGDVGEQRDRRDFSHRRNHRDRAR